MKIKKQHEFSCCFFMPFLELFTKIDMVYRHLLFLYLKDIYVFVQKLLWFILDKLNDCLQNSKYSYKNCYGLSLLRLSLMCTEKGIRTKIVMVYHDTDQVLFSGVGEYSYKNCYGLSLSAIISSIILSSYSYKNCYGLSLYM